MKLKKLVGLSSALAVSAMSLVAQEANPVELRKQLEELLRVQKQQAEQAERELQLHWASKLKKGSAAVTAANAAAARASATAAKR